MLRRERGRHYRLAIEPNRLRTPPSLRKPWLETLLLATAATLGVPAARAGDCPQPAPATTSPGAVPKEQPVPRNTPIEVTSEGASVTRQGDAELSGEVVVRQGNRQLTADSAHYEAKTQSFKVDGHVEYKDPLVRVKGSTGSWTAGEGGTFGDAEFELPTRPARGTAGELSLDPQGKLTLKNARFTTCPVGNDSWLLRASVIEIDQQKQQGYGRDVRLDFQGVPILYTPFITFPAGTARKSGFLFPTIGQSSKHGFMLGAPYYFNLAPNYDATLTPRIMSKRGLQLGGEFRYLTASSRGQLDGDVLPSDRLADRDRARFSLSHVTDFSPWQRLDARLAWASDSAYFEDFGQGPEGTSVTYLERALRFSQLGNGWSFDGLVQGFQTIDQTIDPLDRPYFRLPQLVGHGAWPLGRTGLTAGIDGEAVYFDRTEGVTGGRVDVAPRVSWSVRGPGYFFVPSAAYRYTFYELRDTEPGQPASPTRGAPILSLDSGLTFERVSGKDGRKIQTLEPRLLYAYVPYREQSDLPIFDSGLPDQSLEQVFRTNRYLGADRLADANQLAFGLTTRMIESSTGRQYFAATLGQIYYFTQPRVLLPDEPPPQGSWSNLIGRLSLTAYRNWNVDLGTEWDPNSQDAARGDVTLQFRPSRDRLADTRELPLPARPPGPDPRPPLCGRSVTAGW